MKKAKKPSARDVIESFRAQRRDKLETRDKKRNAFHDLMKAELERRDAACKAASAARHAQT